MSQTFVFDFLLNDEVLPSAIFYGTIAPIILFSCAKKFLINPYLEFERNRDLEKKRENNRTDLQEKRRQAQSVVNLWQETYSRTLEGETLAKGLIIITALYGKASSIDQLTATSSASEASPINLDHHMEVIDVKIPIQCQVKESRLILPNVSKVSFATLLTVVVCVSFLFHMA